MISIIVPIYKAESFLSRCVESVLAQTYTDWELLLIDDGSPDRSGVICEEYASKDSRIKVFHKPNGGVSSARNLGLDNARGEWVSFLDADDYLLPNFFVKLMQFRETDLVITGSKRFGNEDTDYTIPENRLYTQREFVDGVFTMSPAKNVIFCTISYPWGKVLKRNIIESQQLRFNEKMKLSEDTCFMIEYLSCCTCVQMIQGGGYMYYITGNRKYSMSYTEYVDHSHGIINAVELIKSSSCIDSCRYVNSLRNLYVVAFINYLKSANEQEVRNSINHLGIGGLIDIYNITHRHATVKRVCLNLCALFCYSTFRLLKARL